MSTDDAVSTGDAVAADESEHAVAADESDESASEQGASDGDVRSQIEEVIELIRPALQMDGGDIALVDFDDDDGAVTVQLHGSCVGCPASMMTLKAGVERILKDRVPEVTEVVAV